MRSIVRFVALPVLFAATGCGGADSPDPVRMDATEAAWTVLAESEVDASEAAMRVATDNESLAIAWDAAGLPGVPPRVDFGRAVVAIETESFGSGCEPMFMRVSTRGEPGTAQLQYVAFEPGHECAADERWYSVAVAIDRAMFDPEPVAIRWPGGDVPIP